MKTKSVRLRKSNKIYLIFKELVAHLGNTMPRADILLAAQKLVELSAKERRKKINLLVKPIGKENYSARDVFKMVQDTPWLTLSKEYRIMNEFN